MAEQSNRVRLSAPLGSEAPLMYINRPAALSRPVPVDSAATDAFTHRHLMEDTHRQRLILSRLAAAHAPNGRGPMETIVAVLRLAAERLAKRNASSVFACSICNAS